MKVNKDTLTSEALAQVDILNVKIEVWSMKLRQFQYYTHYSLAIRALKYIRNGNLYPMLCLISCDFTHLPLPETVEIIAAIGNAPHSYNGK